MTVLGPTTHSFTSQRLKLRYVEWGDRAAPPLILLHGGLDHCRTWDWTAERLCQSYRVIAPDLRGHGDSDWSPDGDYTSAALLYDFAQLIHQLELAPVPILAHSLGGNIALRYAGLYPDNVAKVISIEGLGPSPEMIAERDKLGAAQRFRNWIDDRRRLSARSAKRYDTIDEAFERMRAANKFLSEDQARHLTIHGVTRNEDGSYSWKFDNYARTIPPYDLPQAEIYALFEAITCPTLLIYGADSWASNPEEDGRIAHFNNATVKLYENAGHWVHHDRFDDFIVDVEAFLKD